MFLWLSMELNLLQTRLPWILFIKFIKINFKIGRHLLVYGRRIHYPETKYLVESITKEDVARCIYALLDKNEKALALVGNTSSTPVVFPDVPQINEPRIIHEQNRVLS